MFVTLKNVILNRIRQIATFIFLTLAVLGCAKVGSIYGGPKDVTPPKVIKTRPQENATLFIPQKKIVITFDEYIQLKDIFQEMIISPPIEGNILTQVSGKSLVIEFLKEAIFDTITYTLSFGNAILDNNEGNVLENYEYVFSLKDYLDTMNVAGRILNSFNHKPDEERMYVMLYSNMTDSAPLLEKPQYICKADKKGNFSMNNLEAGIYKVFALKDVNSNLIYDLPDEQIAFGDSLIILTPERFQDDIIIEDSLLLSRLSGADSAVTDTAAIVDSIKSVQRAYTFQTEMLFFTQEVKNQYLTNNLRERPDQLSFSFFQTLADSVSIKPLNYRPFSNDWYLLDQNKTNDSLIYWLTDTAMIAKDSLQIDIAYPVYDSSANLYYTHDTLLMLAQKEKSLSLRGSRDKERSNRRNKTAEIKDIKKITFKNNISNPGAFDLNKKIIITTPTPAFSLIPGRIKLFRLQDTVQIPVKFQVTHDSTSYYRFIIDYKPEELTSYRLLIPDSTITDIYGITHDTVKIGFKTQSEDFYGTLNLRLSQVKSPVVLQFMDENEVVLMERNISADQVVRLEYLYPKQYRLKVIIDENGNGKWDTGNYLKKIQPEKVIYYPQPIDIRSNWEMDLAWQLDY
jgi:hypothetical protein